MKYDLLSIFEKNSSLQVEGNAFTNQRNAEVRRYGLRRFEGGKLFQSSRLGASSVDQLLADSREYGGPGSPHDFGFAPAHAESRKGPVVDFGRLGEFEEAMQELIAQHPEFVFGGRCTMNQNSVELSSNYGLKLAASGGSCDWGIFYQRRGSGNMFDGFMEENLANPDFRASLKAHGEYLRAQMRKAPLKAGRMPVMFSSAAEPLGKLVESFRANLYFKNSCVFAGKLGEQLFSKEITLVDQAYDPSRGINMFFDGEGTVRKNDALTLIDKGRFASLVSDLRFGHKHGIPSTGNGLRGWNGGVNIGLHSLRVAPGSRPWREILRGLDRCVVAVMSAGGESNDLGEFSTPVQTGYVFEKGELVGLAPQITVKTSVSSYLGSGLVGVSSDGFTPSRTSACVISEMEVLVN